MKMTILPLCAVVGLAATAMGQTVVNDDFTAYSNGNLAGQGNWAVINNASNTLGTFAFNVSDAADTASTIGATYSTNGSYVYLDETSDGNAYDDEWTGTMDFQLKMTDTGGPYGADYSANMPVFQIGLTSETNSNPVLASAIKIAPVFRVRAENGNLDLLLNASSPDTYRFMQIAYSNLGWAVESATPVFETDSIRISWTVRKSRTADTYKAWGSWSNLTTGANGTGTIANPNLVIANPLCATIYADPDPVVFMGIPDHATSNTYGGLIRVDTTLSAISIVKSSVPPSSPVAPTGLTAKGSNEKVTLTWTAANEANSYNVLKAATSGGSTTLIGNTTGTSFEDTAAVNDVTSYYTVQSVYTGLVPETYDSAEVAGAASAKVVLLEWGPSTALATATVAFDISNIATNSGITTVVGETTPLRATSGTYLGQPIYGVMQGSSGLSGDGASKNDPRIIEQVNTVGSLSVTNDVIDWRVHGGDYGSGLNYFKQANWSTNALLDATVAPAKVIIGAQLITAIKLRAAIRNGNDWYVSQTFSQNATNKVEIADIAAESWAPLTVATLSSTTLMADPVAFDTSANAGFTNINAVGFFAANGLNLRWRVNQVYLEASLPEETGTEYDQWADSYDLAGGDALDSADPDMDGLINKYEFAYGGNPTNSLSQGTLPAMTKGTYGGTNGFTYIYRELINSDPYTYMFQVRDDLVYGSWTNTGFTVVGEGNLDATWRGVTNFVPTTQAKKFMRVNVE